MYRPSTFAERLKTALETKDITKAELSRLSGISRSSLTHYVKGDWEGKQDAVYAIAQALNLNEAWLMGYDVPMERGPLPSSKKRHTHTINIAEGLFDRKERSNFDEKLSLIGYGIPQHVIYERFKDCEEQEGHRKLHGDRFLDVPILSHATARMMDEDTMFKNENTEGYLRVFLYDGDDYFAFRVRDNSMDAARICEGDLVTVRRQDEPQNGDIVAVFIDDEEVVLRRFSQNDDIVTLLPQSTSPAYLPHIYRAQDKNVKIWGVVFNVQFAPV